MGEDFSSDELITYKYIFENSDDIILIISDKGNILKANSKAIFTYGYSEEELTNMNICQLRNKSCINTSIYEFDITKTNVIEFETIHYKKDGFPLPVEVKSVGIKLKNGVVIISIIREISNGIKSEKKRRLLSSIIENCNYAIITENLCGKITSWNSGAEKLYGYTSKEVIGKDISIIVPEEKKMKLI